MRKLLLLVLMPLLMGVSDYNMSEYDVTVNSLTCITGTCGVPAASGDAISVNGSAATDPDMLDSATIELVLSVGLDEITWNIVADSIDATYIDETAAYTWTGASTHANATVDGVDAGASTTRSNETKIRIASHNTNCTSLTDGVSNELCWEEDAETMWVCRPTAGGCDTAAEWSPHGNVAKRVVDGTDFVGTVICPSTITGTGTQGDCTAIVTSYLGTTLVGGYLVMAGGYIAADPSSSPTYTGFHPLYAWFSPDTNLGSNGSGDDYKTFNGALKTLADLTWNGMVPRTVLASNVYTVQLDAPFHHRYGTLDACNGPQLWVQTNGDDSVTAGTGTCSLAGNADPNHDDANILTCSTANFCGGDSNCYDDNDEQKTWPSFQIAIDNGIDYEDGTKRSLRVRRVISDTELVIWPPQTDAITAEDFSYANGVAFILDESSTSEGGAQQDNFNDPQVVCPERLTIRCVGDCTAVNPYEDTPRERPTYREVPAIGALARNTNSAIDFNIIGFGNRWDTCAAFAAEQTLIGTSHHGQFKGSCNAFGVDSESFVYGMTGPDKTIQTDDGLHCTIWVGAPNVSPIAFRGGDVHVNLVCSAGASTGNMMVDSTKAQSVERRFYAPRGQQNLIWVGSSREEILHCGTGYSETCPDEFKALYTIGPWANVGTGFGAFYDFSLAGEMFMGDQFQRPVFELTEDAPFTLVVGGLYQYVSDLFDVTTTHASGTIKGDVQCRLGTGAAGDCLPPISANIDLSGLKVRNESGKLLYAVEDGIDLGTGTTRTGAVHLRIMSHNTDCTSVTDGTARELCFEEDDNDLYICEPSVVGEPCNTAGEWTCITC